jgi:hypothetical protein
MTRKQSPLDNVFCHFKFKGSGRWTPCGICVGQKWHCDRFVSECLFWTKVTLGEVCLWVFVLDKSDTGTGLSLSICVGQKWHWDRVVFEYLCWTKVTLGQVSLSICVGQKWHWDMFWVFVLDKSDTGTCFEYLCWTKVTLEHVLSICVGRKWHWDMFWVFVLDRSDTGTCFEYLCFHFPCHILISSLTLYKISNRRRR